MQHQHNPDLSRVQKCGKYIAVFCPNHPAAWSNGNMYMHRVVMEMKIGRLLTKDEVVHHIDENGHNNAPDNLQIKSSSSVHSIEHAQKVSSAWVRLKCPGCGRLFEIRKNRTHLVRGHTATSCSNRCRGLFSRAIQLHGLSASISRRIKQNVVKEFRKYANAS